MKKMLLIAIALALALALVSWYVWGYYTATGEGALPDMGTTAEAWAQNENVSVIINKK
jgi:hypothetical protein